MALAWAGCRIWIAAAMGAAAAGLGWSAAAQAPPQPQPHAPGKPPGPPSPAWSPLKELREDFEDMIHTAPQWRRPGTRKESELFEDFLAWPKNPASVELTVRLTFPGGIGPEIGSLTLRNGEVMVAGRKEPALVIQPDVRGLPPGRYAFDVHEKADCGSALQDGKQVPGLAAGEHLWLKGIGVLEGTSFTSHLGELPELEVAADGNARSVMVAVRLTLADVAGRSLMIHANRDETSERLACAAFD